VIDTCLSVASDAGLAAEIGELVVSPIGATTHTPLPRPPRIPFYSYTTLPPLLYFGSRAGRRAVVLK